MIYRTPLPPDIDTRLSTLGEVLTDCPGVVFAYLFGGVARGRKTPLSDIDIAIYSDAGYDPAEVQFSALRRVSKHLGTDEVDVVILNTAPISLQGRILQSRQVLCDRRQPVRHRFESQIIREFDDFRYFEAKLLNRRFASG